jgi:hypothetical protein
VSNSTKRPTEAWFDPRINETGIGQVIIARFKATGDTEAGIFLVDAYCLGVKNAFLTRLPLDKYQSEVVPPERGYEPISPACARKYVESAIAYARSFGLEPHPDYRLAQRVLGGINPADCDREFTYGHEGKPMYVQGPNDTPEFAARVMRQLGRHAGPGSYDYIVPLESGPG